MQKGDLFSSVTLPSCSTVDRESEILKICRGKRVLHLGCVDDPLTLERVRRGELLHLKIMDVARDVQGIDISRAGIEFLKQQLGIDNIICGDVEKLDSLEISKNFDVIIVGELLEHLANPGLFLRHLSRICTPETTIVISVPNAFALKSFLRVAMKRELVHPDHVAYYSLKTLETLLNRYGFAIMSIKFYLVPSHNPIKRSIQSIVHLFIRVFSPYLADGLIITARRKDNYG